MDNQKYRESLEEENKKLILIFKEFLKDLDQTNEKITELKKQIGEYELNYNSIHTLCQCVKFQLDENTKTINKIYNNEDYERLNKFTFSPDMICKDE